MGGGIKSHQDTVVHPMYVSYNSLPTSAGGHPSTLSATLFRTNRKTSGGGSGIPVSLSATLNRPGVDCHKNFVNFNGNDNLLRNQSWKSCNVKASGGGGGGAASVTGLAADQETTADEFPNYFPPAPIMALSPDSRNKRFQERKMNQRKSMVDGDVSFYSGSEPVDDLIDLQPYHNHHHHHGAPKFNERVSEIEGDQLPEYNSFNRANILVNQRLKNGSFYKMSGDFIPRSPNFSQSGNRRKNFNNGPRNMNFCDQIRGPALEQMRGGASGGNNSPAAIQPIRTRSHTQLPVSSLSRCSNGGGAGGGERVRVHGEPTIHEDIVSRSRNDDWRGGGGSFDAVVGDADIHQKMNQMLRQKKSLRPRSYCGSNYYSEFEHLPAASSPNFVHAPN